MAVKRRERASAMKCCAQNRIFSRVNYLFILFALRMDAIAGRCRRVEWRMQFCLHQLRHPTFQTSLGPCACSVCISIRIDAELQLKIFGWNELNGTWSRKNDSMDKQAATRENAHVDADARNHRMLKTVLRFAVSSFQLTLVPVVPVLPPHLPQCVCAYAQMQIILTILNGALVPCFGHWMSCNGYTCASCESVFIDTTTRHGNSLRIPLHSIFGRIPQAHLIARMVGMVNGNASKCCSFLVFVCISLVRHHVIVVAVARCPRLGRSGVDETHSSTFGQIKLCELRPLRMRNCTESSWRPNRTECTYKIILYSSPLVWLEYLLWIELYIPSSRARSHKLLSLLFAVCDRIIYSIHEVMAFSCAIFHN